MKDESLIVEPNEKGQWPLHYAVMKRDQDVSRIYRYVRERGHPINAQDGDLNTALHWAIWNRKLVMIPPLLELGANPNCANYKGHNALHHLFARIDGNEDLPILKQLLEKDADPMQKDKAGNTAYHMLALGTFRSAEAASRLAEELCDKRGMEGWSSVNNKGLVPIACARAQDSGHWLASFAAAIEYAVLNKSTSLVKPTSHRKSSRL